MGKSRKKTPAVSSISYNGGKRRANKKVRRLLKDPEVNFDKGSFKKAYCSWDIRDYREVAPSFEVFSERCGNPLTLFGEMARKMPFPRYFYLQTFN